VKKRVSRKKDQKNSRDFGHDFLMMSRWKKNKGGPQRSVSSLEVGAWKKNKGRRNNPRRPERSLAKNQKKV